MSFVSIEHLTKGFHGTMVYQDVDLSIERGQICVLVGPSGWEDHPAADDRWIIGANAGTILVDGREISGLPPKDRSIGVVLTKHHALFPNMTVRQNLAFGLRQQRLSRTQVERKVEEMIKLMGLASRADARPAALSGGQKQRVALARALVLEPKLLLLDEPMSALDAQIRKRLREEVKRLQSEVGFTAVLVTHDQEDALSMGDRIAVMQGGRFEQVGTPLEIYNRPANRSVASFIGDFNVMDPAMITQVFAREAHVSWAIHPEAIELNELNAGVDATSLSAEGQVSDMRVMGPVIRYGLEVRGVSLHAHDLNRPSRRPFTVGKRVRIVIAAEDIRNSWVEGPADETAATAAGRDGRGGESRRPFAAAPSGHARPACHIDQGARRFRIRRGPIAERRIAAILRAGYPNYGFLMEESGLQRGQIGNRRWIVDPLDGTTNFLREVTLLRYLLPCRSAAE